jgi:hypothetical protein
MYVKNTSLLQLSVFHPWDLLKFLETAYRSVLLYCANTSKNNSSTLSAVCIVSFVLQLLGQYMYMSTTV